MKKEIVETVIRRGNPVKGIQQDTQEVAKGTETYFPGRNRDADIENRCVDTAGEGGTN